MTFMTKHLGGLSILFAIGVVFATTSGVAQATPDPRLPHNQQIRYLVHGPGVAEYISYENDTGQQHAVNVRLPWSTQFTSWGGEVFDLSAQGPAPIECEILIDGKVVSDQTATTGAPGRTVCTH